MTNVWTRCGAGTRAGNYTTIPTPQRDAGQLTLRAVEGEHRLHGTVGRGQARSRQQPT